MQLKSESLPPTSHQLTRSYNINILPSLAGKSESKRPCVYMYSIFYMCSSKSAFDLHYFVMDESRKDAKRKTAAKT